jgi:signal transduction histidine kinase
MRLPGLRNPSLARRLVLLALVWSLAALVITGVVLELLFARAAVQGVDETLSQLIVNLVSGSHVYADEPGNVYAPALVDERAERAYSGRYWEIAELTVDGKLHPLSRSSSLFGADLGLPQNLAAQLKANPSKHITINYDTVGPNNDEPLRARVEQYKLTGRTEPVIYLAGENRSAINREIRGFITATAVVFILLGAGLMAAIFVQVRVGLRPLFNLRNEVAGLRRGHSQRLTGVYPSELMPLAEELNALVAHNQQVVERQRTHVGNLAHALKTPISVMLTEAAQRPGALAEVVTRQAGAMQKQVDHHLRRARAAARSQGSGERTSVAEVLDELSRTLGRIYRDRGIAIDWDADEDLYFLGERQDLLEIAGNAIENACKWGKSKVRVRADEAVPGSPDEAASASLGQHLRLVVEDDGQGLPPGRHAEVLQRGARLDENAPGSGLGLSIIDELARAYGGSLTLSSSGLGGLRLEAILPRAEA